MALIFIDSFDHYTEAPYTSTPAQLNRKWTNAAGSSIDTTGIARTGIGCLVGGGGGPLKTLPTMIPSVTVGYAYKTQNCANSPIQFYTDPTQSNHVNIDVNHIGDGRLWVKDSFYGYHSSPSSFIMNLNTWYYIEMNLTIATPNANYQVRINEETILSGSLGPFPSNITLIDMIAITFPGGGYGGYADDLYVTDGEFLGDVRIYPLYPRAAGDNSGWIPSTGGAANYTMVNEHLCDDLATIVTCDSAHVGTQDEYYLDMIAGFTGTIKGAQANWMVAKNEAGDAAIQGIWRQNPGGAGDILVPSPSQYFYPSGVASWRLLTNAQRKNPWTGADWLPADINAMQLGIVRSF